VIHIRSSGHVPNAHSQCLPRVVLGQIKVLERSSSERATAARARAGTQRGPAAMAVRWKRAAGPFAARNEGAGLPGAAPAPGAVCTGYARRVLGADDVAGVRGACIHPKHTPGSRSTARKAGKGRAQAGSPYAIAAQQPRSSLIALFIPQSSLRVCVGRRRT
jgi:hypothetical protein